MKKILPLALIIFLFTWSCNGGARKDQSAADVPITYKEMRSEAIRTVANITIDGMTCSAGCGGKIQQDLRALNGVTNTTLDFVDERPSNIVSVEYNPSELKELDLIKCVNGISDGKYQVKSVEVLNFKGLQSSGKGGGADVKENNFGRVFQLLNLLQSVAQMIKG